VVYVALAAIAYVMLRRVARAPFEVEA
jgi:hypothetical protein